jgi:hypothetical protein
MKRTHVDFQFSKDFAEVKKGDVKNLYKSLAHDLEKQGMGKMVKEKAAKVPSNKVMKEPLSNK